MKEKNLTSNQVYLMTKHLRLDHDRAEAVHHVIIGGSSAYASEQLHMIPKNTLSRTVKWIRKEFEYCEQVVNDKSG